jgi:hypothetical protein
MALAPVLRALQLHPDIRLRVFGYRQAFTLWLRQGLDVEALPDDRAVDPIEFVRDDAVALLLTATSVNGVDHERSFRRWASWASVASVAVLDFWSNYSARFRNGSNGVLELPSAIAIMDARAHSEMVAEGFPAERLVVTGQPAFDAIETFRAAWSETKRREARKRLSVEMGCKAVLFVSQPLSEMAWLTGSVGAAIDEREILDRVAASLEEIAATDATEIVLAVRPHPRQQLEQSDLPSGSHVRVMLAANGEPWPAVLAADVVVGMTSVLLVEACLLGCTVVSVQPGGNATDPLPTSRSGDSVAVYDVAELTGALRRALAPALATKCARSANSANRRVAADHIVELVLMTMANQGARNE